MPDIDPTSAIDPTAVDRLDEAVGGDAELIHELLGDYLREGAEQVSMLVTALASGDAETLRRTAHTLASTSATFGAQRLSEISRTIEHAAAGTVAEPLLSAVAAEFDKVKAILPDVIAKRIG